MGIGDHEPGGPVVLQRNGGCVDGARFMRDELE